MRIIIETDQHIDEIQRITTAATGTASPAAATDGGPAPAALLRQFGRVIAPSGERIEEEGTGAAAREEALEKPVNPLRHGQAIATGQQAPDVDTRQEADETTAD
jgi:hypothetical protein